MSFAPSPVPGPAPASRPRRPTWHWLVLGGIGLVGLLVLALVAGIILWQILVRGNPQDAVDDFYTSLAEGDCELFQETTTERFRDATFPSCAEFDAATAGISAADYTVDDRMNRQGYAMFTVTETVTIDGRPEEVQLRYYIVRAEGDWYLDGIELIDGDAPAAS